MGGPAKHAVKNLKWGKIGIYMQGLVWLNKNENNLFEKIHFYFISHTLHAFPFARDDFHCIIMIYVHVQCIAVQWYGKFGVQTNWIVEKTYAYRKEWI